MTSINAMISSAYFHLKARYEQCKILFYYSNLVALHIADMDSVKQGNTSHLSIHETDDLIFYPEPDSMNLLLGRFRNESMKLQKAVFS